VRSGSVARGQHLYRARSTRDRVAHVTLTISITYGDEPRLEPDGYGSAGRTTHSG